MTCTVLTVAEPAELVRRFGEAGTDHESRSPFNARLNLGIAERPDIASLLAAAPEQQQLPVLLLAAVHSIVLAEPDGELASWYPTTADEPLTSDPFPAFARLCDTRADEIESILATRSVQTNEVGRCALILPALAAVAADRGPLALIDVGTSAGLNLRLDQYAYEYSPGGRVGDRSPVTLTCGTRGDVGVPSRVPAIASRVGIDREPMDVDDPDDARWLMACVWPDQADRFARLRAAIEIARSHPATIVRGDAVDTTTGARRSPLGSTSAGPSTT